MAEIIGIETKGGLPAAKPLCRGGSTSAEATTGAATAEAVVVSGGHGKMDQDQASTSVTETGHFWNESVPPSRAAGSWEEGEVNRVKGVSAGAMHVAGFLNGLKGERTPTSGDPLCWHVLTEAVVRRET